MTNIDRYSNMPPTYPRDVRLVYITKQGNRYTRKIKMYGRHDKLMMYDTYIGLLASKDVVSVQYFHLKDGVYKTLNFSNVMRAIFDTPGFRGSLATDFKESIVRILDDTTHKVVV